MRGLLILFTFVAAAWGQTTIIDYLEIRRFTELLRYIEEAGLTSTLNGTSNYTIFASNNIGYYRLPASLKNDTANMTRLVKYQIIPGSHRLADIDYNEEQRTSLQGTKIRINRYLSTGRVTAEGESIESERDVSNGVVFVMYSVLQPPVGTVLDIISNDNNLTTLRQAIQTAGLDNFFKGQNPITLFAPSNDAFNLLGSAKLQALLKNPTLLESVLKYHVIPGSLYTPGYHSVYMHTFQESDRLRMTRSSLYGLFTVEGATIQFVDESASNGVVHRITEVLIPASLASQVNALTSGSSTK